MIGGCGRLPGADRRTGRKHGSGRSIVHKSKFVAVALAAGLLLGNTMAVAQTAAPTIPFDESKLPRMDSPTQYEDRSRPMLLGTGAGAVLGILAADLLTGGLLLAPLGVPAVATWLGAGAALAAPPTYSLAQRLLAGVATLAAGVGGGYLGGIVGRQQQQPLRW